MRKGFDKELLVRFVVCLIFISLIFSTIYFEGYREQVSIYLLGAVTLLIGNIVDHDFTKKRAKDTKRVIKDNYLRFLLLEIKSLKDRCVVSLLKAINDAEKNLNLIHERIEIPINRDRENIIEISKIGVEDEITSDMITYFSILNELINAIRSYNLKYEKFYTLYVLGGLSLDTMSTYDPVNASSRRDLNKCFNLVKAEIPKLKAKAQTLCDHIEEMKSTLNK